MRKFKRWTRERIEARIDYLVEQLSLGVTQISNPDTGSSTFSASIAERMLGDLDKELQIRDGIKLRSVYQTLVPRIHPDR